MRAPRWLALLIVGESEILRRIDMVLNRLSRLERIIMAASEALSSELTELGTAVDDLAGRIASLPDNADEVTQDQLDSLKSITDRVVSLAQAAPEVPTTDEPTNPGTPSEV